MDTAAAGAALAFNGGNIAITSILKGLGIDPGYNTMVVLQKFDKIRIRQSNKAATERHEKNRRAKRKSLNAREDKAVEAEGITYESGAF